MTHEDGPLTKATGPITLAEAREIANTWIHPVLWRQRLLAFVEQAERAHARVAELEALINAPQTADFLEAVRIEAAHQRERWGDEHDARKTPEDWFWTLGFLAGKAIRPEAAPRKRVHHIIAAAALLANWHRHENALDAAVREALEDETQGGSDG